MTVDGLSRKRKIHLRRYQQIVDRIASRLDDFCRELHDAEGHSTVEIAGAIAFHWGFLLTQMKQALPSTQQEVFDTTVLKRAREQCAESVSFLSGLWLASEESKTERMPAGEEARMDWDHVVCW